jgi:type III pantothenate kinase
MLLAIDIGNTNIKTAVFEGDKLLRYYSFDKCETLNNFKKIFIENKNIHFSITSSVGNIEEESINYLKANTIFLEVNHQFQFPFSNMYTTPTTLGVDRMVLMAGAALLYSKKNVLVIDCGTCVTYDFINKNEEYFGGAISPGLNMRYKALHTFTAKLPLLKNSLPKDFLGESTNESIYSGVVNGLLHEIDGFISQYSLKFQHLTIILTGGDAEFLAKSLKSTIFAHSNFLLESLNALFHYYKKKEC